ncbi:MAG: leucine-rich repeat protein, partial [Clostridia bacterium]|nr:leucine-rich repeat protein [Clostridia bacterium]
MKYNIFVRFLSFLLSAIMVVTLLPLSILAEDLAADADEGEELNVEELISDISESEDSGEVEYTDPAPGLDEVRPTGDTFYTNEGFALRLNSDSASYSVVGFINAAATSITVPDNYDGKPVTHIGDSAFKDKENLEHVTIGANVVYIGDDVFGGCVNLKFNEVDGVNYIGTKDNAHFYAHSAENSSIAEYIAPAETRIIGSYAFHNCRDLKKFALHADIIQVGFRALRGCDYIEDVTLPFAGEVKDGTANVHVGFAFGARTYGGNISFVPLTLKRLTILGGSLQKNALYGLDNVTHLGLPTMTAHLGYYYGAETYEENINYIPASLTSVSVQSGDIPDYAFKNCVKITDVELCDGVTSIGTKAFEKCNSIKSIFIGSGVELINNELFKEKNKLESVTIQGNGNTSIGTQAFYKCSSLSHLVIGDGVTFIGESAFSSCANLTSVLLGHSIKTIGAQAFYQCSKINSIYISNSVLSIDSKAFYGCRSISKVNIDSIERWCNIKFKDNTSNPLFYANDLYINDNILTNIIVPEGTTNINSYAFNNCTSMKSLTIPESVQVIGTDAFNNCTSLESINIFNIASWCNIEMHSNPLMYSAILYLDGAHPVELVIDDGTKSIPDFTFRNWTNLESIKLPDSIETIGTYAFYNCQSLKSINIPESVTSINEYTFFGCKALSSLDLPDCLTYIGPYAFCGCASFTSIKIPDGVESIYEYTFLNCLMLSEVSIPDSVINIEIGAFKGTKIGVWIDNIFYVNEFLVEADPKKVKGDVIIPEGVQRISKKAFYECWWITSVTFPQSLLSIGDYAFYYCNIIEEVKFGNKLVDIGERAFGMCQALTSVTIPGSVQSIGYEAFDGCTAITSVTICNGVTSIGEYALYGCYNVETIMIPNSVTSIDQYAFNADFLNIVFDGTYSEWKSIKKDIYWRDAISDYVIYCTDATVMKDGSVVYLTDLLMLDSSIDSGMEISYTNDTNPNTSVNTNHLLISEDNICLNNKNIENEFDLFIVANSVEYSEGLLFTSNGDGTCSLSGIGSCVDVELVLPATSPEGDKVTSIDSRAFSSCTYIKSVTMPNSIVVIGNYAFTACSGLEIINFSENLEEIGINAFAGCTSISNIAFPNSVSLIRSGAFSGCSNLMSVSIPTSLKLVESDAFYNCKKLEAVYITNIATWCSVDFMNAAANPLCYGQNLYLNGIPVVDVVIPNGVSKIGSYAFYNCRSLLSIDLPNTVTEIGDGAFYVCLNIKTIILNEGIQSIGYRAFADCDSLLNITIPNSVKWIGRDLIWSCHNLEAITIGNSILSINESICNYCPKLTTLVFSEGTKLSSISSKAFDGSAITDIYFPLEENAWRFLQKATDWDGGLTDYTIHFAAPGFILYEMSDDRSEFFVGEYIDTVRKSDGTVIVSDGEVAVPETYSGGRPVTMLYDKSFFDTDNLVSVFVPESVIMICSEVFYNCSALSLIEIESTESTIQKGMIFGCNSLETLIVPFLGSHDGDVDNAYIGYHFGADSKINNGIYLPQSLKSVTVDLMSAVVEYAFSGSRYLTEINIPENITSIGDYAYSGCESLNGTITIGNSVISIGEHAFEHCSSLNGVVLGEVVDSIGDYAFSYCNFLTEFTIPDSVEEIGVMIFDNCDGLKSITIGKNIKSIPDVAQGNPAFGLNKASSSLEKYVVSEGNAVYSTDARGVLYEKHQSLQVEVGVIDAPAKSDLLDYVLPNHIVYIAPYAFAYNTSLRWIQLDRVRRIDRCAFFGATSLVAAVFGQKGVDVNETAADTEAYNEYLKMIADVSEMQESYQQFIGEQAFAGCLQLRYVNLYSDFIIHIGDLAFFDCESLENIYISSSLQSLGHRVFDEAMPEYIEVEADSKCFKSVDGVLYRNTDSGYILELYPARKITADSYSSDGSKQKEYETSFSLPEDMKIVAIQSYAFGDTAHLTEVDLSPSSDMIIGDYAFSESNVRVINIGDRVTSIGLLRGEGEYTVFSDCMQLSKINVSKDNPYYSSQNGVLFDKLKYKLIKYPVMKSDKEYTIPEGVSVIASMAFKDCGELVILSIPSYINTIGLEAFYGARNLSSIYFNHVYAPLSVMENAFTTSTEIEGETYDPKTMILYSEGYYENGGEGEYGWVNYEGVYNIHECTVVPEYNPAQTGKVYYAVVVVDSTGMPLDNIAVTLTDPKGVAETIVTGYSNSSATGLSESGDGIAMFYDLYGTEGMGFAIDFEREYSLSAVDLNERYFTYMTDTLMLDSDMCITYITLTLQPSVYGVDLSGKDINTETAVINKAEYGTTDRFDFINGELVVLEKDVPETVEITVIGYYDKSSTLINDECMLYQNGTPIPGCKLVRVNNVELGVSQITFELPVDRLIPEVPIEAKIGVVSSRDGSLSTATAFLNIDVIDFTLTADDITLDVGDLKIDLEAAGSLLKTLLGKDDLSFNLGKNVQLSIVPDGDTVTVSLNGSYKKEKETKKGKHVETDCEKGYKKNHEAHNKNTWFFKYPAFFKGEEYTVNIRVARGTEKENYFYYQMSIYKGYYALTENMVARHFGVFNAYGGRSAVKAKSLIIYYTYMVSALDKEVDDITKGEVYKEPVIAPVVGSQTSHSFEVTAYGDLQFKYEKGKGLVPVASTIKGDIKYTFLHGHQFMVWVIPVYFEITVDLEGNLLIKLKYDEGVSVEEAKLTLQAVVTAQVGIGCKVLSAGVKGKIGMVFVLEFAPELGVDSWNVYGGLYAYVTYVTIKFQKGWLGLYYPVVGTDTKEAAIWEGNYYIIGGPDSGASSASY